MSNKEVQVYQGDNLAPVSVDSVLKQQAVVQQLMKEVLKKDVHYGKIPGCGDKDNLLKPGGEKLCFTFRMVPKYETETRDLLNDHREYFKICRLYTYEGLFLGEASGVCSTKESKYRWRDLKTSTGKPVPKDYWTLKNKKDFKGALAKIGGKGFGTVKEDGRWFIAKIEKIENPDIADTYNTVDKMAEKRAFLGVVRQVLAVSDIFNQDMEEQNVDDEPTETETKTNSMQPPKSKSENDGKISGGQMRKIQATLKQLFPEYTSEEKRSLAATALKKEVSSMSDLTLEDANSLIEHLDDIKEMKEESEAVK